MALKNVRGYGLRGAENVVFLKSIFCRLWVPTVILNGFSDGYLARAEGRRQLAFPFLFDDNRNGEFILSVIKIL